MRHFNTWDTEIEIVAFAQLTGFDVCKMNGLDTLIPQCLNVMSAKMLFTSVMRVVAILIW